MIYKRSGENVLQSCHFIVDKARKSCHSAVDKKPPLSPKKGASITMDEPTVSARGSEKRDSRGNTKAEKVIRFIYCVLS